MSFLKKVRAKNLASYIYILIGYSSVFLNVLLSILLIRKLNISDFGRVSIGKTIFQSFEYSHLGIRYGYDRSLPVCEDHHLKQRIFWAGFYSTVLASLGFAVFWAIFYHNSLWFYSFFIASGLIYAILQLIRIYYRSEADKQVFVKISGMSMLLPIVAQIVGFLVLGTWGLLLGLLLSYVLSVLYALLCFKIEFLTYHKTLLKEFKMLFSQGYILFLTTMLVFAVSSGDRVLIEKYWGLDMVGEYSIIMFIFSIMAIFPVNYTELIMSRVIKEKSLRYVIRHVFILAAITCTMCVAALLLLPLVFSWFLPQYLTLFPHMKIVVWAAVPYSMMSLLNYFLHGTDNRGAIFLTNVITAVLYFIALFFILDRTRNVDYILIAKTAYYVLGILMLFGFSFRAARKAAGVKPAEMVNFMEEPV